MEQTRKSALEKRLLKSINLTCPKHPSAYSQKGPAPGSCCGCGTGDLGTGRAGSLGLTGPAGPHGWAAPLAWQGFYSPLSSSLSKWLRMCRGHSPETSQSSLALLQVFKSYFLPASLALLVSKHCQIYFLKNQKNFYLVNNPHFN